MAQVERVREVISRFPSPEELRERYGAGWRPVAIEWERDEGATASVQVKEAVPFGLRVSDDCFYLEDDPVERRVLRLILHGIVEDEPLSRVADELNAHGLHTRRGRAWTQTDVFNLLPRIVEVAPRIFSTDEWATRKQPSPSREPA